MPRVTIKQNAFYDNNIVESECEDDNEYANRPYYPNGVKPQIEPNQPIRTTLTGLDPKRLEKAMRKKRPSSAPLKKQNEKENVKSHLPQETDSSVDLRKYIFQH